MHIFRERNSFIVLYQCHIRQQTSEKKSLKTNTCCYFISFICIILIHISSIIILYKFSAKNVNEVTIDFVCSQLSLSECIELDIVFYCCCRVLLSIPHTHYTNNILYSTCISFSIYFCCRDRRKKKHFYFFWCFFFFFCFFKRFLEYWLSRCYTHIIFVYSV